jgi:hypothetical protein
MGLSDSRQGRPRVMFSPRSAEGKPSPCRASQVPRPICPCAPPPITSESPTNANTCCFIVDSRLHPIRRAGHSQLCNEAESSSLALRLTRLSARGFNGQDYSIRCPSNYMDKQAISMVGTFQLTRFDQAYPGAPKTRSLPLQ